MRTEKEIRQYIEELTEEGSKLPEESQWFHLATINTLKWTLGLEPTDFSIKQLAGFVDDKISLSITHYEK